MEVFQKILIQFFLKSLGFIIYVNCGWNMSFIDLCTLKLQQLAGNSVNDVIEFRLHLILAYLNKLTQHFSLYLFYDQWHYVQRP